MQYFIIAGLRVLIKCCPLIRTAGSYRKDLNLIRLILIYKMSYKIILYEI
jgi:hypothetical protein